RVATGRGRGGSVRRVVEEAASPEALVLASPEKPPGADEPAPHRPARTEAAPRQTNETAQVIAYRHDQKRKNNPDVGVVTPETDPEQPRTTWAWDPHIDPALQFDVGRAQIERLIDDALASGDESVMRQALEELKRLSEPYLNWTGKAERTSFEVDTVSLHVHERIDPASLLAVVKKRLKKEKGEHGGTGDMFRAWFEEPLPYREAIEFYRHDRGWANRLVAGDSLLVMNSLLQKEGMAGQVQMIYIDPPYGIKYGSNFQPFVNKRDVKDRKDEDLTQEPEMIKAFRDTWELGIHSYLSYLRDRLLVAKELLTESGSCFVQISDENLHLVRNVMDEVFGSENCLNIIPFVKTSGITTKYLASNVDFLVWYGKDREHTKYRTLYQPKSAEEGTADNYSWLELADGTRRGMNADEKRDRSRIPETAKIYKPDNITSQGNPAFDFVHQGKTYKQAWKTNPAGMDKLAKANRLHVAANSLQYVRYITDFPCIPITQLWTDTGTGSFTDEKRYVVQTGVKVLQRCMLMCTDPGDLVLDPTCGSGTTAAVAEQWGRRWITVDTSRIALNIAKTRLMTSTFPYYHLYSDVQVRSEVKEGKIKKTITEKPEAEREGDLRQGFVYEEVPHITLKSLANDEP
ncbi:MAG TPA: site-specific DNA-methyltransferase, partial [Flavobacteriales bacterium]|nr:site-specific DNA-methyltransferase [Flavobacteriales bacterium]